MTTDLLTVTQWLSPAFPLGSFAYSHGLETAISDGFVTSAGELEAWLATVIRQGSGWNDAVILAVALRGEDVTQFARAQAGSRERLEESEAQGAAFAATLRAMGRAAVDAPLPVTLGQAARTLDIAAEDLVALYLQSFASNLVQGAVRFVPLGQSEGQAVLAALAPVIRETGELAAVSTLEQLGSGAFLSEIAAMRHEQQSARVFRT